MVRTLTPLSRFTTLRLGGPAQHFVECQDETSIVETVRACDAVGEPLLILGGGSNLVVGDDGFPGTVLHIVSSGIERDNAEGRAVLRVAATGITAVTQLLVAFMLVSVLYTQLTLPTGHPV